MYYHHLPMDLKKTSFEELLEDLSKATQYKAGVEKGDLLFEKFRYGFEDVVLEKDSMLSPKEITIKALHYAETMKLISCLYHFNSANQMKSETLRQQSLENIKTIITPFFSDKLKLNHNRAACKALFSNTLGLSITGK